MPFFERILFLSALLLASTFEPSQCTNKCIPSELENNIHKLTGYVSDSRYFYPKTEQEFTKFCEGNKDGTKFLKEYSSQCLRGVSKTIISVFAYSNSRVIKKFCTKSQKAEGNRAKNEMVSYAHCVNPNKALASNCYRTFLNKLNLTHSIPDPKNRIPYMCCLNVEMKSCIVNGLLSTKHAACTEEVVLSYGEFFDSISSNVMNSVCDGSEESSDRCTRVLRLPKRKPTKVNLKSPFPIVISIFDTL